MKILKIFANWLICQEWIPNPRPREIEICWGLLSAHASGCIYYSKYINHFVYTAMLIAFIAWILNIFN